MKKIVFAAHDRGGLNAVLPVWRYMQRKRALWKGRFILSGPAAADATGESLQFDDATSLNSQALENKIIEFKPDAILTGTSGGRTIEKKLIPIARRRKVPITAVLDAWYNYAYRFSFRKDGGFSLKDLPDVICVMDKRAKREMVAAGFPRARLCVTGNPFFETFKPLPQLAPSTKVKVLFVDQHFSELLAKGLHEDIGFDEREVFSDVISALERIPSVQQAIIKLHPGSRQPQRYDTLIPRTSLSVVVDTKNTLDKLLARCTLVLGMNSAVLFEAALRGKAVLSYQPHLNREDPLMSNRLGLSLPVYEKSKLVPALKRLLQTARLPPALARARRKYAHRQATQNVINCVLHQIKRYE